MKFPLLTILSLTASVSAQHEIEMIEAHKGPAATAKSYATPGMCNNQPIVPEMLIAKVSKH